jgi:hypothetical protein
VRHLELPAAVFEARSAEPICCQRRARMFAVFPSADT